MIVEDIDLIFMQDNQCLLLKKILGFDMSFKRNIGMEMMKVQYLCFQKFDGVESLLRKNV